MKNQFSRFSVKESKSICTIWVNTGNISYNETPANV